MPKTIPQAELELRNAVAQEALSWVGTPYHLDGHVKGPQGSVDCATLLTEVGFRTGIAPRIELGYNPDGWYLHEESRRYLDIVEEYYYEVMWPPERDPLPGDIVVWFFGRSWSHGGFVYQWPQVVHAYRGRTVELADANRTLSLSRVTETLATRNQPRPRKFYTLKGWH